MNHELRIDHIRQGPIKNNVWVLGDDNEVVVIDAAHDAKTIAGLVGERQTKAILITHGHFDHIDAALTLKDKLEAPVYLRPEDQFLWEWQHPGTEPDMYLEDGDELSVGGSIVKALHTPGHTPGSTCYYVADIDTVFTGDTLFPGGPGATRWDYSGFDQIIDSINNKLFQLPESTHAYPGHGRLTTIATEKPNLEQWLERGW